MEPQEMQDNSKRLQPYQLGMLVVHPIDGGPVKPILPRSRDAKIAVWLADTVIAKQLLKAKYAASKKDST